MGVMRAPAAKAPTMMDAPIPFACCSCWASSRTSMQESEVGAEEGKRREVSDYIGGYYTNCSAKKAVINPDPKAAAPMPAD